MAEQEPRPTGQPGTSPGAGPARASRAAHRSWARWAGLVAVALLLLGAVAWPWLPTEAEWQRARAIRAVEAAGFVERLGRDTSPYPSPEPPWFDHSGEDADAALAVLAAHAEPLNVTALRLEYADDLTSLEPLRSMALNWLFIFGPTGVTSLEPLRGMPLNYLFIAGATGVTSLEPLRGMPLRSLFLQRDPISGRGTSVTSLEPLAGSPLSALIIGGAGLTSLEPLRGMRLTTLGVDGSPGITSLEPLRGMPLRRLYLTGTTGLTSLDPLAGMPLEWLDLSGATGITTLAPLRGLDPGVIHGASPALLATLEE